MKYSVVLMALLGTISAAELEHHHHHHTYYAPVSFVQGDGEAQAQAEDAAKPKKAKKSKSKGKGKKSKSKGKGKKGKKGGSKAKTYKPVVASGDGGKWTPADSRRNFEQHVMKANDVV